MGAPILWAAGIYACFLQENLHVHKIPRLGEGPLGPGGGSADFVFMGAGIFLTNTMCGALRVQNNGLHQALLLQDDSRPCKAFTHEVLPRYDSVMDATFVLTVGSFLLTVGLFYLQLTILALLLTIGAFCLQFELFDLQLKLFCLQ